MMTDEATPAAEAEAERVPWRSLTRNTHHRTSGPTNDRLRDLVWAVQVARHGRAPSMDTLIFAALCLIDSDDAAAIERLRTECERIEGGEFVDTRVQRANARK